MHKGQPPAAAGPAPRAGSPALGASGKPGPARRVRPAAEFSMEPERMGAGERKLGCTAATGLGSLLPGLSRPGKSTRVGQRASRRRAARERGARPRGGPGGRAGSAPGPRKHFRRVSHPPRQDGDVDRGAGRRGWGREGRGGEGRGGEAETKRRPPAREARPRERGGGAGGERGRPREGAYFFLSFAPPAPSMATRSPRRLHGRRPPGSLRPTRWLPAHAGEMARHGQRRGMRGGKPSARREAGGAGGSRKGPEPAQKSLPSGCLSRPSPTRWPKRQRGRSSRPLGRGGSVHWAAEAAAGGGLGRRRAWGRAHGRGGGWVGQYRGRARPRGPARAHASPPHLRGRRVPWEPMADGAGGQAPPQPTSVSANQEAASWGTAGPGCRAHVLVCVQRRRKEDSWGAASVGLGTPRLLLGKAVAGWLWEALLRRDFGFWVPSLHHVSCSLCSKSLALFLLGGCAVQGCRQLCWVLVQKSRLFASWQQTPVPLLRCVTMGSFLPGRPTTGHVTDHTLA